MVVTHTDDGPIVFNHMLPEDDEEVEKLEGRINTMNTAIQKLRENAQINDCGDKVIVKGHRLNIPLTTGIREFFKYQIVNMDPEIKQNRPFYKLMDESGNEFSDDAGKVESEINRIFDDLTLKPRMFIQGPMNNTQLLSHGHCFMFEDGELPDLIDKNYYNLELILDIKKESRLVRTSTPPIDEGMPLERTSTVGDESLVRTSTPPIG